MRRIIDQAIREKMVLLKSDQPKLRNLCRKKMKAENIPVRVEHGAWIKVKGYWRQPYLGFWVPERILIASRIELFSLPLS